MNENLRQALLRARLREQDVAAHLGVDPKTVRRWIEGRIPYPANRAALVDLLCASEADLWPDISGPLASGIRPNELVAVYPHHWAIPRATWEQFFASAERELGILAYSALFLAEDTGLVDTIADKARQGVEIRILLGNPQGHSIENRGTEEGIGDALAAKAKNAIAIYTSLNTKKIQLRTHNSSLVSSVYRSDDQLFVNQYIYGTPAAVGPVFHFRKVEGDGLFDDYLQGFEQVWNTAEPYQRSKIN